MDHKMAPIVLFGNIEENFYQLGLKDKEAGKIVHKAVKSMLKTPFTPLNSLIEEVGKNVIKNKFLKSSNTYPHLKAYAEGMGQSLESVFYTMLIPELVSGMTKWAPGMITAPFGCSSFITRNTKDEVIHGRILDFPLQDSYDIYERKILYSLDGMPKTVGLNTVGIPYPSITAMTEKGMTIALHQKFTNIFNMNGESIFEIIFDLIKNVSNKDDAIKFLNEKQSLTTWCLYMSFQNGDVLAYDIMGENHSYNSFHIESNQKELIYFCNHLENKELNQTDYLPLGFHEYNCMRENMAQLKIKEFNKKNKFEEVELLKMMTSPLKTKGKFYQMDTVTPTSITATVMNPTGQLLYEITGPAPKIYRNNIIRTSLAFNDPKTEAVKDNKYKNQNEEYYKGLRSLTNAQKGFDDKNPQAIYHDLQFAIDHLENYNDKIIAQFYFLIAQYLYETHAKVHSHLLDEFKVILKSLEGYLKEQCLLFIFRLEKILNLPVTVEFDLITNEKLKAILEFDSKIPSKVLHFTNRTMTIPRIDILDVIYVYTH